MVTHLKKDEHNNKLQRLLLEAGNRPPPMARRYKKLNDNLSKMTSDFEAGQLNLEQYVQKMAYKLGEPAGFEPTEDAAEDVSPQPVLN